jgi:hypothetical protein
MRRFLIVRRQAIARWNEVLVKDGYPPLELPEDSE